MDSLTDKTLIMLVAPSAMGKSTIMLAAQATDSEFSYVKSFTDRPPRASETTYTFLSTAEANRLRETGQAITYTMFPTTGYIYGTTAESYQSRYNLLDTLANSVASYRSLPFQETKTISLTAPLESWRKWFTDRYSQPSDEAKQRLGEAKLSINWSLADPETQWLINDDTPENVAHRLIDIAHGKPGDSGADYARAILELIETGRVWHEETSSL